MTMYLSTVQVHSYGVGRACLGVLLDRNRVAFPELYWKKDTKIQVCVFCKEGKEKASQICLDLGERIPEEERFYIGQGIIEAKVSIIAEE